MSNTKWPQLTKSKLATFIFWVVASFYGYGALVHVLNIAGMSGFEWTGAPLKWQVLDVSYLFLDVIVCVGLFRRSRIALIAFYFAAVSQIILYTVLRGWITDVPEPYSVTPKQESYFTVLVLFHVTTILMVTAAVRIAGDRYFRSQGVAAI